MKNYWKKAEKIHVDILCTSARCRKFFMDALNFYCEKFLKADFLLRSLYVLVSIIFVLGIFDMTRYFTFLVRKSAFVVYSIPYPYYKYKCGAEYENTEFCRKMWNTPYSEWKSDKLYKDLHSGSSSVWPDALERYKIQDEMRTRTMDDPYFRKPYDKVFEALKAPSHLFRNTYMYLNRGTRRNTYDWPDCKGIEPLEEFRRCMNTFGEFGHMYSETIIDNKLEGKVVHFYIVYACDVDIADDFKTNVSCNHEDLEEEALKNIIEFKPISYYCQEGHAPLADIWKHCTK